MVTFRAQISLECFCDHDDGYSLGLQWVELQCVTVHCKRGPFPIFTKKIFMIMICLINTNNEYHIVDAPQWFGSIQGSRICSRILNVGVLILYMNTIKSLPSV